LLFFVIYKLGLRQWAKSESDGANKMQNEDYLLFYFGIKRINLYLMEKFQNLPSINDINIINTFLKIRTSIKEKKITLSSAYLFNRQRPPFSFGDSRWPRLLAAMS